MSKDKLPEPVQRPLVATGVMTEFGEVFDDPEAQSSYNPEQVDVTWTPGWSEMRIQRDQQLAEAAKGQRPPQKVMTLPGHLALVRRSQVNGQPDATRTVASGNAGYRPVTKADVGQPWFTAMPAGAVQLPDGSIAKGDCVYMFCDAPTAARNAYRKQKATLDRLGASEAKAEAYGIATDKSSGEPINLGSQIGKTAVS